MAQRNKKGLNQNLFEYNITFVSSKISFIFLSNFIILVIQKILYGETIIYKL